MRRSDRTRNHAAGAYDPELAAARIDAHRYFDPLWHFGLMERDEAYAALAKEMKLSRRDCHIGSMTKEQALSVREHAAAIRKQKETK